MPTLTKAAAMATLMLAAAARAVTPIANQDSCQLLLGFTDSDVSSLITDECVLPAQGGETDFDVAIGMLTSCSASTDVPGTWGPGMDPRYSIDCTNANSAVISYVGPTSALVDITQNGWTWASWLEPQTLDLGSHFLTYKVNVMGARAEVSDDYLTADVGGNDRRTADNSVDLAEWHHYAATWDRASGGVVHLYKDGTELLCDDNDDGVPEACVAVGSISQNTNQFAFMGTPLALTDYDGLAHETLVANRALSPEEICKLARCGATNQTIDRCLPCTMPPAERCAYEF